MHAVPVRQASQPSIPAPGATGASSTNEALGGPLGTDQLPLAPSVMAHFSGLIVQGKGEAGPLLAHPTFNLIPRQPVVLRHGTYVARAGFGQLVAHCTLYWGRRPTMETSGPVSCEVHLLEGSVSTFAKARELDIEVLSWLRPDERFPTVGALRQQLALDRRAARARLEPEVPVSDVMRPSIWCGLV